MRTRYATPPVSGNGVAPTVASTSGLGTGGGAGVFTPDGNGYGYIDLLTGANPVSSGNVVLHFSVVPPTLFFGPHPDFGAATVSGNPSMAITLAWTGATLTPNARYQIPWEWL